MHNKKGFSLISFLVYLLVFSMVTACMCHIITILIIPSFVSLRKNQSVIAMHIATDCFVRDVKNMKDGDTWNVMFEHELIWPVGDHNIGWSFSDHRLQRKEGIYKNGWSDVKTSIVAKGLENAVFVVKKDNDQIAGIELTLTAQCCPQKPVSCYISLKKQKN